LNLRSILAGTAAGAVNGLFGAGGGMVLIPLLSKCHDFSEREVFASSVVMILPMCLVSLFWGNGLDLPWQSAWPYLVGGALGGFAAVPLGQKIQPTLLHRLLGILILYGGVRYLC
jgi:uncharacterized membrane protein YfcA